MARVSISLLVVLASLVATLDSTQAATFKQCTPLRAKQAEALLEVRVVKILDGDTVDVQLTRETRKVLPYRVRLAEIDAPEKDQPFGKASSTLLGELVNGKPITLRYRECDRYHRIIGRLYVADQYVAEVMLANGAAWFNSQYSDSAVLFETENVARDALRGLWGLPKPQIIEPWVWRKLSAEKRRKLR